MIEWHKSQITERMYCNIKGGKKVSMPRYYKNKIYSDEQRKQANEAYAIRLQNEVSNIWNGSLSDIKQHLIQEKNRPELLKQKQKQQSIKNDML